MAKKTRKSKVAKKPTRKSKKLKKKGHRAGNPQSQFTFRTETPVFVKAAPEALKGDAARDVNARRSGFQSNLSIGIL